jgi:hypothetical protein
MFAQRPNLCRGQRSLVVHGHTWSAKEDQRRGRARTTNDGGLIAGRAMVDAA